MKRISLRIGLLVCLLAPALADTRSNIAFILADDGGWGAFLEAIRDLFGRA